VELPCFLYAVKAIPHTSESKTGIRLARRSAGEGFLMAVEVESIPSKDDSIYQTATYLYRMSKALQFPWVTRYECGQGKAVEVAQPGQ
jgi:hypothetical protein